MKNRRISLKTAIACTAAALTVTCGMFSFLAAPAYARSQPAETISVNQLSDIADGYDASTDGIAYEIEIPTF